MSVKTHFHEAPISSCVWLRMGGNQRNTQSSADPKIVVLSSPSGHLGSSRPRVVFASLPSTHSPGSNPRVLKRRTNSEASRAVRSEPTSDVVDLIPTAVNNQTCKYRVVLHAANGTGRTTPGGHARACLTLPLLHRASSLIQQSSEPPVGWRKHMTSSDSHSETYTACGANVVHRVQKYCGRLRSVACDE